MMASAEARDIRQLTENPPPRGSWAVPRKPLSFWRALFISSERKRLTQHHPMTVAAGLEVVVEGDLAGHADLVGGDPAFEEVGQLLDVLEVHERQRVPRAVQRVEAELGEPPVRDVLQVGAHVR